MSAPVTPQQDDLTPAVAEEIRAQMARRRVTGAQLAKRLGVSAAWVSYRINGMVSPSVQDLGRIATALGLSVADLLPRDLQQATRQYLDDLPNQIKAAAGPANRRPADRRPGGHPARTRRLTPAAA